MSRPPIDHSEHIAQALKNGGHLVVGQAGSATLYFKVGAHLTTYEEDHILAECVAAGLTVIDARPMDFMALCNAVIKGPMPEILSHRGSDAPPYNGMSYAPLAYIVSLYRDNGAAIHNWKA